MSLWRQIYDFFFQLSVFCANYLIISAKIGRNETKTRCLQSSNETSSHFFFFFPSHRRKDKISSDDEKKLPTVRHSEICLVVVAASFYSVVRGLLFLHLLLKKTYEVAHVLVPQFG